MTAQEYAKILRVQQQFYDVAQILGVFWTDTYIIAVIWLNSDKRAVDRALARSWHLIYGPERPAC
jgi:hypothetical protein